MTTFFIILHLVITVLLIFIVLAQEGKDPGMRGIQGSSVSDTSESFFSRNGGNTREALFNKLTTTVAVLFLITTLVLVVLVPNQDSSSNTAEPAPAADTAEIPADLESAEIPEDAPQGDEPAEAPVPENAE